MNIDLGKTFTEIKASLSDVSGNNSFQKRISKKDKLSIHTQTLPKGVYVLSIQTNQHNFNKKSSSTKTLTMKKYLLVVGFLWSVLS